MSDNLTVKLRIGKIMSSCYFQSVMILIVLTNAQSSERSNSKLTSIALFRVGGSSQG